MESAAHDLFAAARLLESAAESVRAERALLGKALLTQAADLRDVARVLLGGRA